MWQYHKTGALKSNLMTLDHYGIILTFLFKLVRHLHIIGHMHTYGNLSKAMFIVSDALKKVQN